MGKAGGVCVAIDLPTKPHTYPSPRHKWGFSSPHSFGGQLSSKDNSDGGFGYRTIEAIIENKRRKTLEATNPLLLY